MGAKGRSSLSLYAMWRKTHKYHGAGKWHILKIETTFLLLITACAFEIYSQKFAEMLIVGAGRLWSYNQCLYIIDTYQIVASEVVFPWVSNIFILSLSLFQLLWVRQVERREAAVLGQGSRRCESVRRAKRKLKRYVIHS